MKRKFISTLLVMAMLLAACASIFAGAATTTYPFTDVPSWASEYVQIVYEKTIMKGTGGNNFGTNDAFTREQMVTTLYNMAKANVTATEADITAAFVDGGDVSSWARKAVKWAVDNGITSGIKEGGKLYFKPQKALSRAEAAVFIISYLNYSNLPTTGDIVKTFEDEGSLSWAKTAVEGCVGLGIINGIEEGGKLYFKPAKTLTRIEAAVMLAFTSNVEPERQIVNVDPYDPNPTNIGEISYGAANLAEGMKVSNAVLVDDAAEGNAFTATMMGNHGWVENRIVRSEFGTYMVMAVNEELGETGTYSGSYQYGLIKSTFYLLKATSNGFEKVLEGKYHTPHGGSCAPNVLNGKDGKIYVVIFTVDSETYYKSNCTVAAACLDVYEFDTETDTLVYHTNEVIEFPEGPGFGFGYNQNTIDLKQGKIYSVFAAGGVGATDSDGYVSWFIYDLASRKWEEKSYMAKTPPLTARGAYFHVYPDGKGGIYFLSERDTHARMLERQYAKHGIEGIKFSSSGYAWDAVYLLRIADMHEETLELVDTVFQPDYTNTRKFPRDELGQIDVSGASHYEGGTSYLDSKGYLHVVCQIKDNPCSYSIYDTNDNLKRIRRGNLNPLHDGRYFYAFAENTSGDVFMIAVCSGSKTTLELYKVDIHSKETVNNSLVSMITDANGKKSSVELTYADGTKLIQGRLSYTGTRNVSVQDNTVCIVTASGEADRMTDLDKVDLSSINVDWGGTATTSHWSYFSIRLPD